MFKSQFLELFFSSQNLSIYLNVCDAGVRLDRMRGGRQKYKRRMDSDSSIFFSVQQPHRKQRKNHTAPQTDTSAFVYVARIYKLTKECNSQVLENKNLIPFLHSEIDF